MVGDSANHWSMAWNDQGPQVLQVMEVFVKETLPVSGQWHYFSVAYPEMELI